MSTHRLFARAEVQVRKILQRARFGKIAPRLRRAVAGFRSIHRPRVVSAQTLSEEEFLAKFDLEGSVGTGPSTGLRTTGPAPVLTREALLAHYGRRVASAWPGPPSGIRDLRVNTDRLSRDELIALADDILACRFVLRRKSPIVTPEGKIAWHKNPDSDREWLLALHRHQWWAILGLAYAQTGDERYAAAFVGQLLDWAKNHPLPAQKNEKNSAWRLMEVGLRMRVSWIPCFGLFYNSPVFTDEAKVVMLRSIYDHAQFLSLFKTNRNHLLRESNGLACVGTCFPEFIEARRWQQIALTRLDEALVDQFNQDGSHIEVSTGYQSLVIDEFQQTYDLLRAYGLSLPSQDLGSWLERMYRVMAYLVRPDGTFPQVNDGSIYWDCTQLAQAGETFGRDDLVYIGTGGSRGSRPKETSVGLDDAGLYVMRGDWTEGARYLLFDAGPYGGPHGHEDKLSIEVFAFGQPFIVDAGSYTYDKADPFRRYFVGSQGHNTVMVDGKSQIRRWRKDNLNPKTALGRYATWISQPGFDYVSAQYGDGYSVFRLKRPKGADVIEDVSHTRRILFLKPDYWLIVDELEAQAPHKYQVLFHAAPGVVAQVGPENRVVLGTAAETATLHLVPVDSGEVRVSCLTGSTDPIQGWYSPNTRHKTPATAVIYEKGSIASTVVATLLYPCHDGCSGDQVRIEPLVVSGGRGLAFVVTTERGRDYLLFSQDDGAGLKQFGPYQARGLVAGVRTDGNGRVLTQLGSSFGGQSTLAVTGE